MKTKEEFIKLVDNRFLKHLLKNSLIPFENTEKGIFWVKYTVISTNTLKKLEKYK